MSDESSNTEMDEAIQEVMLWAYQKLQSGEAPSIVLQELVRSGWSPEAADYIVDAALAAQRQRPPVWTRIASGIGSWGVLVLVYLLLNGILWGGQEIMAVEKKREAVELEQRLDALEVQIKRLESRGITVGLTSSEDAEYNRLIDAYNRIVPDYNEAAKAAYSRWWLLPIPVPGGRGRTGNY